ncbi:hypothetical protein RIF29_34056 [Crotalaria pallida]|uniref:RING-type E3 ubiquitin transferase n=1 Tax=Crotalaria pallida TaxID=3830 RepID=A0AAN9EEC4_CROPI
MSSAGGGGGGGGNAPHQYFCYECNRTVSITPSSDLTCPNCNSGFVEEVETPIPQPQPFSFTYEFGGGDDLPSLFGARSPFGDASDAFNPLVFLQNYIQTLRAGGANVQFVIDNSASGDPLRLPTNLNLGDYFFGPGLEQLIQHLAENDPNRYGTPPASKSAVEGLPNVAVTEELLASDSSQCAVCKDTFELQEIAKQLPCKHIYHSDCILPWLELHNSCPVCRYELPTDDPDYEQRAQGGGQLNQNQNQNQSAAGDSSQSQSQSPRERRFRVALPWPFRQFAGDTSNVGNDNNNNNNNNNNNDNNNTGGESNAGSRGNQNFESETRQEDLD